MSRAVKTNKTDTSVQSLWFHHTPYAGGKLKLWVLIDYYLIYVMEIDGSKGVNDKNDLTFNIRGRVAEAWHRISRLQWSCLS